MLNHAVRYSWLVHQNVLRPSVLGRPAGSKAYSLSHAEKDEHDPDEAIPSRATHDQMRAYFDARRAGDEWAEKDALNKVTQYWRADNAAGGVPVHAHLPLPEGFAKRVALLLGEMGDVEQQQEVDGVVTKLEPSIRTHVVQQLAGLMKHALPTDSGARQWLGSSSTRHADHRHDLGDALSSDFAEQANDRRNDSGFWRTRENDREARQRLRPLEGEDEILQPLQAARQTSGGPNVGAPTGANGILDEEIGEANPQDASTIVSRDDRYGPPWYTPGDWRKHPDPRTRGNTRLVGPERLTTAQKRNLAERNWIFPTDGEPEYGPVGPNYPFFGARRREPGEQSHYHGGYDARYKRTQGQPPDRRVVAPTQARFKGFRKYAKDGKTVINAVTFDLGDGLVLELLHIEPTPQILALDAQVKRAEARAKAAGRQMLLEDYPTLDAGHELGNVDEGHDHTHMQLLAQVDGVPSTVDLTLYMERRARRYWRRRTNDWLERRLDDLWGEDLPNDVLPR